MNRNVIRQTHPLRVDSYDRKNNRADDPDVDTLSLSTLLREYLCEKGASECVKERKCPCLDVCRYGQRYIALTKDVKKDG